VPAPYSGDLRDRVAASVASGTSARSAAGRFGVSVSTADSLGAAVASRGSRPSSRDGWRSPLTLAGTSRGGIGAGRQAAAERTREGLWQAIGRTLDRYQPQECRNFFKNAGYAI
jgi:transposase